MIDTNLETLVGEQPTDIEALKQKIAEMERQLQAAKGLYRFKPEVISTPAEIPVYNTSSGGNRFPKMNGSTPVTQVNPKFGRLGIRLRFGVVPNLYWYSEAMDMIDPENIAKIREQLIQYADLMQEAEKRYLASKK